MSAISWLSCIRRLEFHSRAHSSSGISKEWQLALNSSSGIEPGGLCEYCHAPQAYYTERFQIDHIIARQHGGETIIENLALCCLECNRRKGPNLSGVDPLSNQIVTLFHPRNERWLDHFKWENAILVGLT